MNIELFELTGIILFLGLYTVGFLTGFFIGRAVTINGLAKEFIHSATSRANKKRNGNIVPFIKTK